MAITITGMDSSTDSGTLGDNTTDAHVVEIDGTTAANGYLQIYDVATGANSGLDFADGTGHFINFVPLGSLFGAGVPLGYHTVYAVQYDSSNNVLATSGNYTFLEVGVPAAPTLALSTSSDSGTTGDNRTDIASPMVHGSGTVGDTVVLYNGNTAIGSITVGSGGTWSMTAGALALGSHTLTAKQNDAYGDVSAASTALTLTIDPAPTAPTPGLTNATDSGTIGDNATDSIAPVITGSGTTGDIVTLYENGTLFGSATVASGVWSISVGSLALGSYSLTTQQADAHGNVSALSSAVTLTINPMPVAPSAPVLDPTSDTGTLGDDSTWITTPLLTGTGTSGDTVTIYDASSAVGSAVVTSNGNWSVTTSTLSVATHSLTTKQTDPGGDQSTASSALSLVVVPTPSSATIPFDNTAAGVNGGSQLSPSAQAQSFTTGAGGVLSDLKLEVQAYSEVTGDTPVYLTASTMISGQQAIGTQLSTLAYINNYAQIGGAHLLDIPISGGPTLAANTRYYIELGASSSSFYWDSTTNLSQAVAAEYSTTGGGPNLDSSINHAYVMSLDVVSATGAVTAPASLLLAAASDSGTLGDGITDVTTPMIDGTGTAGDTITLYDYTSGSPVAVGTAVVTGGGAWSVTVPTLSIGMHVYRAQQTDTSSDTSGATTPLTLDIVAAPATLSLPTLAPASDSGTTGDGRTDISTPVIDGSGGTAGDTVVLYNGNATVGSATVANDGTWSVTTSALSVGGYALTATQSDSSGDVSTASSALNLIIDPVPSAPTLSLATASDSGTLGDHITDVTTPIFHGIRTNGNTITLYDSATVIGSTGQGGGSWSTTSSALALGNHTITATQTDTHGNISVAATSYPLTIVAVPATPAGLTLDAGSDSGTTQDNRTDIATPQIDGSGGVSGEVVTLFDGSTAVGSTTVAVDGTWSVTTSTLTAGSHALAASETDADGDPSPTSTPLTLTIDPAPATPPFSLDSGSDSGTPGDDHTDITTPQIDGTDGTANDTITLYDGINAIGSVTLTASGAWSIITGTLALGDHSLTTTQADPYGNVSGQSDPVILAIDTVPDMLGGLILDGGSDSGTPSDNRTDFATPQIDGSGGDSGDIVTLYDVTAVFDGESVSYVDTPVGSATVAVDGTWSVTTSTLALGDHTLLAIEADADGNPSPASDTLALTIDAAPLSLTIPVLDPGSDSGTLGDGHTDITTPLITGTDGTDGDTVTLYDDGTLIGSASVAGDGTWSITTPTLALGEHVFAVTQADPYGNVSAETDPLFVTVDAVPDVLGGLILDAASDSGTPGDDRTDIATPQIDGNGGDSGDIVTLFEGSTAVGSDTVAVDGTWSVTTSTLAPGDHTLTAIEADAFGNPALASESLTLTIDAAPLSLTSPVLDPDSDSGTPGDGHTDITTPLITGTAATVGDTILLYDDGTLIGLANVAGDGTWSSTTPTLALGEHVFAVTQADPYGNVSAETDPLFVTVDAVPDVLGGPILDGASDSGTPGDDRTDVATPQIDGNGGDSGDIVTLFDGSTAVGSATVAIDGTWSVTTSTLALGDHTLTAIEADAFGNAAPASESLTLTIDAAPLSLTIPVLSPGSDSGTLGDHHTDVTTPLIIGTEGTVGDTVTLYDGITAIGTAIVAAGGAWSITTPTRTLGAA